MLLAEWKAVGCKLGSHTCLSATEFGVVASPQGPSGTGVKALPCVGAAEGPPAWGAPPSRGWGLEAFTGHLFFLGHCSHPRTPPAVAAGVWREAGQSSFLQEFPCTELQQLQQGLVWSRCLCCFSLLCARATQLLERSTQCHYYVCACAFKAGITLGSPTLQGCTSTWSRNGKRSQN